jgi:hypothetical protein
MLGSIFNKSKPVLNKSKPVYEFVDDQGIYSCYGFYFQLSQKISEEPIFCFICDPKKSEHISSFHFKDKIKINRRECLLPLNFKAAGAFLLPNEQAIELPTVIGEIALTAEPLCASALESFLVKIELEREVQNLQHKHSLEKIEQIRSNLQEIDSQLELFATNLGELFDRIVKERNLLNGEGEFALYSPIELARRNKELQQLLAQFHQLDG